jgi:Secretion system C-terminal sorting domain/Pregnancy-associated plasma protein-A
LKPITFAGIVLGEVFGYAYPPAGLPNWPAGQGAPSPNLDGVVIDYVMIGRGTSFTMNTGGAPITINVEGRTTVHEVGHHLGLRHIWGDGGGFGGGNSCGVDDGCQDTPNQGAQSNFDCDQTQNTCTSVPNDSIDMVENYMDYSAETCQNTFTHDQIAIMRGVLGEPRSGLTQPLSVENIYPLSVEVYPNPSNGNFNLSLNDQFKGETTISIFDCLGRIVLTKSFNLSLSNISVELDLVDGLYFLSVENGGKRVGKRVVVEK